ncbi:hypothetical protein B296_00001999 [Ensete ventricosum]|uniref:Uncharacterized protein n=1 Tax=Ensete ventricosum TaxID=4639 RepID=A0A427B1Z8_ENSVE|nr:hypothetical protein B296_00001999 [Ensete ventricosum]
MCPSTTEEASNMSLGEEGSYARRQQRQRKLRTATVTMEAAGDGVGDGGSFEPIPRRQMELHKKQLQQRELSTKVTTVKEASNLSVNGGGSFSRR